MTPEDLSNLEKHMSDPYWRLNNLYTIINKSGDKQIFNLNWAQKELYDHIWFRNVILKARQLGISTFVCLFFLDICLFRPNTAAGIIAHTREDAEHMFKRIKFAYDQLPDAVKGIRTATVDSARELVFNNHSSLRVGTSMRGSTLQYLHISEFGKICAHFPDKAREIVTGSLNTLGSRQYVFIESTAEGKEGYFYDICKQAESHELANKKLTSLDYRFHFYPWYDCPDYVLNEIITIPKEIGEYFEKVDQQGIKLNDKQKAWYYKTLLIQKDDMKREYPSTPDESFESAIDGSFYARWLRQARFEGRISNVPWDRQSRVCVAFDPGYLDSCAIVFWQHIGQEVHVIDYYENSGEGLSHYLGIIKAKPYIYDRYFGPHDIESHQFSTGLSTKEVGASLGVHFITLPTLKLRLEDGIEAVRGLFPRFWIDEQKCTRLIKCIENYRKEYDVNYQIYKSRPVHDQYSHGCFVENTLITTPTGMVPIQDVKEGDLVCTPSGARKVLKTFCYSAEDLLKISFSEGEFTCTSNHKIFSDKGLVHADSLRYNDVLFSEEDVSLCHSLGIGSEMLSIGFRESFLLVSARNMLSLTATDLGGMDDIIAATPNQSGTFIRQCIAFIKGRFLTGGTLITKMGIQKTIPLRISKSLAPAIIRNFIRTIQAVRKAVESAFTRPWNTLKSGILLLKGLLGIENMPNISTLDAQNLQKGAVLSALENSSQKLIIKGSVRPVVKQKIDTKCDLIWRPDDVFCAHQNFRPTNIQRKKRVVSCVPLKVKKSQKVYDFEVEKDHCYYANGILVSNSDAFRYMAIAIRQNIDSDNGGISDEEADRLYNKYYPKFE